jgi:hypothetical protein
MGRTIAHIQWLTEIFRDFSGKNIVETTLEYQKHESSTVRVSQFCDTREILEQTDPFRELRCPPDKGWAIVPWNTAEGVHPIVEKSTDAQANRATIM